MIGVPGIFGTMVFNDRAMQNRLPKDTYKELKKTIKLGNSLNLEVANVIANAMKDWATEKGATHFTHWFQPMTGITAEKHDSFISPSGEDNVIMEFSGKELVKGEPDASSFPSGGLRATFEARGYTVWDTTSYAFIKDNTLCIPTAFCSYSGEALDKKTPLLRSMEAIDKQAMRVLRLLGDTKTERVVTTVGAEQEYFLIDKAAFEARPDLKYTGRTLLGARPPKGQELEDHYFGAIKPRVSAFMKELDEELWKLGVYAKTEHNEVAPGQHELAPIFGTTNIATDHNQLTMELMKSIANKHNLACLLHEKPFAGVNGSGKHNNWSISTNNGENLLEASSTPSLDDKFLLFLAAVIKAVDEHQDLLRISVASAGNDHRLGANEAPPAIVSMFLGEELTNIVNALESGALYEEKGKSFMKISAKGLPQFLKDTTDRNRTSPFAFTGNKFEFRMLGSSFSLAGPNIVLNTIVADSLKQFADQLEKSDNFVKDLHDLLKSTIIKHKRIIFNGNNYSNEWLKEAEKRGLLNLASTVDAMPYYIRQENIDLFCKHGVFTKSEMISRYEILLENYVKTLHIEALTLIDMVKKEIMNVAVKPQSRLAEVALAKIQLGVNPDFEQKQLQKLSLLNLSISKNTEILENDIITAKDIKDKLEQAKYYRGTIFCDMLAIRGLVDEMETIISSKEWPFPSYADMLHSVN